MITFTFLFLPIEIASLICSFLYCSESASSKTYTSSPLRPVIPSVYASLWMEVTIPLGSVRLLRSNLTI